MTNQTAKIISLFSVVILTAVLTGCGATHRAVAKRNLDVQTKMSATIFLDPVAPAKRTVFVQIRNTSDKPDFDIEPEIRSAMHARGYQVVEDPDKAHYLLQANVLQVGRASSADANHSFEGGFGGAVLGGGTAYAISGGDAGSTAAGAVGGAIIGTIVDAYVQDVYYSAITDIQIKERMTNGGKANLSSRHRLKQGTSGSTNISYAEKTDWRAYQTRVMSTANQVNLEFHEAAPELRAGLVRVISGLF